MRPSGEEEYHRVLGFPASLWPRAAERPDGAPAAGGRVVRAIRHPIAWSRWRMEVRRRGPYAPSFGHFLARQRPR
jgi:hypothetical protein